TSYRAPRLTFFPYTTLFRSVANTTLFQIIMGEMEGDSGSYHWGVTTSQSYFPKDNSAFFEGNNLSLVDWLRQYSPEDQTETFLRGFLGRMLFSGEEALKKANVLDRKSTRLNSSHVSISYA